VKKEYYLVAGSTDYPLVLALNRLSQGRNLNYYADKFILKNESGSS